MHPALPDRVDLVVDLFKSGLGLLIGCRLIFRVPKPDFG